ncbi:hypothetical protein ACQUEN_06410 [Lactococcus taiwanensis]|uniref:hypothetical protein n=1 Tax=Lactococcus taiwanensis TaxID=1151742 RepID=UPI003D0A4CC1
MKKRFKREAGLAVAVALVCQLLAMFAFSSKTPDFWLNLITVLALALAIVFGVRSATVVEHQREGEAWKNIIEEELHEEKSTEK